MATDKRARSERVYFVSSQNGTMLLTNEGAEALRRGDPLPPSVAWSQWTQYAARLRDETEAAAFALIVDGRVEHMRASTLARYELIIEVPSERRR